MKHRVEVVQHAMDNKFESWITQDGRVALLRARGARTWRAVVDRVPVTDAEMVNGPKGARQETVPADGCVLKADTAHNLAMLLAIQDHLHLIFDA